MGIPNGWLRGQYRPVLPDEGGTVEHLVWRNGGLYSLVGRSWTSIGNPPAGRRQGRSPSGLQAASDLDYYTLASPNPLNFSGASFSAQFVVQVGSFAILQDFFASQNAGQTNGYDAMLLATSGFLRLASRAGNVVTTGNAPTIDAVSVLSIGLSAGTLMVKVNSGTAVTGAVGTFTANTADAVHLGNCAVNGYASGTMRIFEAWFSTTAGTDAFLSPRAAAALASFPGPIPMRRTACIGDSITFGYAATRPYPISVGQRRPDYWGANYGVSGDQTSNMLTRWTGTIRATQPDVVAFMGGINDIRVGAGTAASAEPNIQNIFDQARSDGHRVVALSLLPFKGDVNWSAPKETERLALNTWLQSYCATNSSTCTYVDLSTLMDDGTGALKAGYDSGDHLHPNQSGTDLMAQMVSAVI